MIARLLRRGRLEVHDPTVAQNAFVQSAAQYTAVRRKRLWETVIANDFTSVRINVLSGFSVISSVVRRCVEVVQHDDVLAPPITPHHVRAIAGRKGAYRPRNSLGG